MADNGRLMEFFARELVLSLSKDDVLNKDVLIVKPPRGTNPLKKKLIVQGLKNVVKNKLTLRATNNEYVEEKKIILVGFSHTGRQTYLSATLLEHANSILNNNKHKNLSNILGSGFSNLIRSKWRQPMLELCLIEICKVFDDLIETKATKKELLKSEETKLSVDRLFSARSQSEDVQVYGSLWWACMSTLLKYNELIRNTIETKHKELELLVLPSSKTDLDSFDIWQSPERHFSLPLLSYFTKTLSGANRRELSDFFVPTSTQSASKVFESTQKFTSHYHFRPPMLPKDIWSKLTEYLTIYDLLSIESTCVSWRKQASKHVWKSACLKFGVKWIVNPKRSFLNVARNSCMNPKDFHFFLLREQIELERKQNIDSSNRIGLLKQEEFFQYVFTEPTMFREFSFNNLEENNQVRVQTTICLLNDFRANSNRLVNLFDHSFVTKKLVFMVDASLWKEPQRWNLQISKLTEFVSFRSKVAKKIPSTLKSLICLCNCESLKNDISIQTTFLQENGEEKTDFLFKTIFTQFQKVTMTFENAIEFLKSSIQDKVPGSTIYTISNPLQAKEEGFLSIVG